jgi:hypothetical protein
MLRDSLEQTFPVHLPHELKQANQCGWQDERVTDGADDSSVEDENPDQPAGESTKRSRPSSSIGSASVGMGGADRAMSQALTSFDTSSAISQILKNLDTTSAISKALTNIDTTSAISQILKNLDTTSAISQALTNIDTTSAISKALTNLTATDFVTRTVGRGFTSPSMDSKWFDSAAHDVLSELGLQSSVEPDVIPFAPSLDDSAYAVFQAHAPDVAQAIDAAAERVRTPFWATSTVRNALAWFVASVVVIVYVGGTVLWPPWGAVVVALLGVGGVTAPGAYKSITSGGERRSDS